MSAYDPLPKLWREWLRQQWALIVVVVTACMALIDPSLGAKGGVLGYEYAIPACIVSIFVAIGLTIPLKELAGGTRAVSFHILCQSYGLLVTPLAYFLLVYYWGWERKFGILTDDFAKGVMAALCMPTTAFTCVMFTKQVGGDDSVAVVNAAIGNLIGPVVSPMVAKYFMGSGPDSGGMFSPKVLSLVYQLVLPLILGVASQLYLKKKLSFDNYGRLQHAAHFVFDIVLVVALYFIFCEGFASGGHSLTVVSITLMTVWVFFVHVGVFAGAWAVGSCLHVRRRAALMMVSSQKTEGMAVAILAIISPLDSGVLTLPVVAYHTVQMAFAASITPRMRAWVERETQLTDEEPVEPFSPYDNLQEEEVAQ
eukprot:gene22657-34681_t